MKKLTLILTIGLFLFSCKKEVLQENKVHANNTSEAKSITNFSVQNGILHFESWDVVSNLMSQFEIDLSAHTENFESTYPNLNEDQRLAKEEEIGWNEFQPLIDFETTNSFNSLRKKIDRLINDDNLTEAQQHEWFSYPVENELATLINEEGLIVVENHVFKFLKNGIICSSKLIYLDDIRLIDESNFQNFVSNKNFVIYGEDDISKSPNCKANYVSPWKIVPYNYGGKQRRIQGRFIIRNIPNFRYVKACTVSEYRSNNRWKNWRTNITAHTSGNVRQHCSSDLQMPAGSNSPSGTFSKTSAKRNYSGPFRVIKGEFGSIHTAPNITIYNPL